MDKNKKTKRKIIKTIATKIPVQMQIKYPTSNGRAMAKINISMRKRKLVFSANNHTKPEMMVAKISQSQLKSQELINQNLIKHLQPLPDWAKAWQHCGVQGSFLLISSPFLH